MNYFWAAFFGILGILIASCLPKTIIELKFIWDSWGNKLCTIECPDCHKLVDYETQNGNCPHNPISELFGPITEDEILNESIINEGDNND